MTPLINGTRHAWANIRVNLLGGTVSGMSAVMYKDNQAIEDHYGAGVYPTHRGEGNYKAEASITLSKYEIERIQAAAAGKRLQEIPEFDVIVTYLPVGQDVAKTDIIRNCRFLENGRDNRQGATNLEFTIPLLTSHILWFGMTE